jgi:protein TonB
MAVAAIALMPLAAIAAPAGGADLNSLISTSCPAPDAPAAPIVAAVPEMPMIATSLNLSGTTYVQVDLEANGAILNTSVMKSSGTPILDRAALESVRASSFRPEVRSCVAVAGSYLMEVDFPE